MTWSLRVHNGDLTLNQGALGIVSAENKLVQDLRHYLLERMGTDNLHPGYGSLLDGGVRPNGVSVPSLIANSDFNLTTLKIDSEIRRIGAEYQDTQQARAKADTLRYNKTTLTAGEILVSIDAIDMRQHETTLEVIVHLTTATNQQRTLSLSLT